MVKSIYNIYLLLVCFFAIIITVFSAQNLLYDLFKISFPEYAYYSSFQKYDSDEAYLKHFKLEYPKEEPPVKEKIAPERLEKKMFHIKERRNYGIERLFSSLIWLLISSALFFIHWVLFRRENKIQNV